MIKKASPPSKHKEAPSVDPLHCLQHWKFLLRRCPTYHFVSSLFLSIIRFFSERLPWQPLVKTLLPSARSVGLIPGQGAKILHASRSKSQNKKQKPYCNKFNKDFKNGPHQNKKSYKRNLQWDTNLKPRFSCLLETECCLAPILSAEPLSSTLLSCHLPHILAIDILFQNLRTFMVLSFLCCVNTLG